MQPAKAIALSLATLALQLQTTYAASTGAPAVYRCEIEGVPTFSDRPCAADAVAHRIEGDAVSTYEPPAVGVTRPSPKPTKRKGHKDGSEVDLAKQRQTCDRLKQRLDDVRAHYRSGYSAAEGERLKARETRLKEQLRSARCR